MFSATKDEYNRFSAASKSLAATPLSQMTTTTGIPMDSLNQQPKSEVSWSSGLCDCFSDRPICCLTCWCPCMTFGQIAEIVDKGSSSCGVAGALCMLLCCVTCSPCCFTCFYRAKMRKQYMLKKRPCGDCLVHCCCMYCALCQEHRELRNRGFEMTVGWHGNLDRETRGVAMTPIVPMTPMTALEPVMEDEENMSLSN